MQPARQTFAISAMGKAPFVLVGRGFQHGKALRVTGDLAHEQCPFQHVDRQIFLRDALRCGAVQALAFSPLVDLRRQVAHGDGGIDCRDRSAQHQRFHRSPAACALLTGGILDDVDQRFAVFLGLQQFGGDFDEIGFQRALVPLAENVRHFGRRHAKAVAHDAVDFRDHLHVGIFDAIVDHFHEMPRSARSHEGGAGGAVIVCGNGLQQRADPFPDFLAATDHDGRAVAGALGATGNADTQEGFTVGFRRFGPAVGVMEVGIARIDDRIALGNERTQALDMVVHDGTGGHHEDDRARSLHRGDELFQRFGGCQQIGKLTCLSNELVRHAGGAVHDREREPLLDNVECQVGPHRAKADQACFRAGFLGIGHDRVSFVQPCFGNTWAVACNRLSAWWHPSRSPPAWRRERAVQRRECALPACAHPLPPSSAVVCGRW